MEILDGTFLFHIITVYNIYIYTIWIYNTYYYCDETPIRYIIRNVIFFFQSLSTIKLESNGLGYRLGRVGHWKCKCKSIACALVMSWFYNKYIITIKKEKKNVRRRLNIRTTASYDMKNKYKNKIILVLTRLFLTIYIMYRHRISARQTRCENNSRVFHRGIR